MNFKFLTFCLLLLSQKLAVINPTKENKYSFSELASLAKGSKQSFLFQNSKNKLENQESFPQILEIKHKKLISKDLSDLFENPAKTVESYDYKLENPLVKNSEMLRKAFNPPTSSMTNGHQPQLITNQFSNSLKPEWKSKSFFQTKIQNKISNPNLFVQKELTKVGKPSLKNNSISQTIKTEFSDIKVNEDYETPLNVHENDNSLSIKLNTLQKDFTDDKVSPIKHLAHSLPRRIMDQKRPLENLQIIYRQMAEEYQKKIEILKNTKQDYLKSKKLRNESEKKYENFRDSLQSRAHEYKQDLIVAKIDAGQLLKSKGEMNFKIEELKKLEKSQADHFDLLQRKHDYLFGAFELLRQKQTNLLGKKTSLNAERQKVQISETDYEEKVKKLKLEMDDLQKEQEKLNEVKANLAQNRNLLEDQVKLVKKRQETREFLINDIEERKLVLSKSEEKLKEVKGEFLEKMKQVMGQLSELDQVKKGHIEKEKDLDAHKQSISFEKSKLDEKITLLDKKEKVLKSRESDYLFKEQVCHCRSLKEVKAEDLVIVNPFQVIDRQHIEFPDHQQQTSNQMSAMGNFGNMNQIMTNVYPTQQTQFYQGTYPVENERVMPGFAGDSVYPQGNIWK